MEAHRARYGPCCHLASTRSPEARFTLRYDREGREGREVREFRVKSKARWQVRAACSCTASHSDVTVCEVRLTRCLLPTDAA